VNTLLEIVWRRARRALYLTHRWLGIACCVLFVLWFVSGLVMLHVRFPRLTPQERMDGLEVIDLVKVQVSPQTALTALNVVAPRKITLESSLGQPVWRVIGNDGEHYAISATPDTLPPITAERAGQIAAAFARASAQHLQTLVNDQWTLPNANDFDKARPLHLLAIDDHLGTHLYVSAKTGEVVRDTHAFERRWTQFGTLLHYYTYAPIRRLPGFWRQLVLWTSGIGMCVALTGLTVGVLRVRFRRRYRGGTSSTPYRGWMAWHHIAGLVGGVSILTWVFSGWFSMSPNRWLAHSTPATAAALFSGMQPEYGHDLGSLRPLVGRAHAIKMIEAAWYDGQPVWVLSDAEYGRRLLHARSGQAIAPGAGVLAVRAQRAFSAALSAAPQLIEQPDRYWYHRHVPPLLPVWRIMLDDEPATWLHVDSKTGQLLATSTRASRLRRWLFNGLHSLDFPGFMKSPAWYLTIWALSLAGLVVSVSGVVIGWRRLRR